MPPSNSKRSVLITGCSDGGMGAELAIAFHRAGLHVYATARNTAKMAGLKSMGIETMELDIQSEDSIAACVKQLDHLDILVNNAGSLLVMPVADLSIPEAKKLMDINLWAQIAVTQAFLPMLLQSPRALLVNHTSVGAVITVPFQAAYNASKAAFAKFSDCMRLELHPFGLTVVDLRTAGVKTNIIQNHRDSKAGTLPPDSIYQPAKEAVEKTLRQENIVDRGIEASKWAESVVADLMKKNPPPLIWRGEGALMCRTASAMPFGTFDGPIRKLTGLDVVEKTINN
jgi:1-acylglycerone phosphate reductase